jgi:PAS domain S-box-containing protein
VTASEHEVVPSSKILLADNKEKPVRAHLHSVRWKGEHALLLSLRPLDETAGASNESAEAIEKLSREVAELSSVLETATDGVVFVNNDGTIRSINQSAEALFGFDPAAVANKPFTHLLATESQKTANDYIANLAGTGVASLMNDGREVIGREAHGRFIPLFMTIGKLDANSGYCVVLRDITQWKRAEEDLSAAKRAAEHASTQKSEFLARVSHEIRTPLNAIIGFSDMMSEERFGPVGNPRYLDYLNDINRSGRHVLDLVNDLLDISKIEAGQQEMNFESVGLNEALAEAVAIMQPQANRDRVIIRSSFATDLPEVVADVRSIKQIALNLLANAVRYTGPGGQVIVSTSYELTGGVAIRVRDTGVGMSAQDIEQALKPFKQVNTLKRERGDGTGLGLPLTKAMVEANRASFAISSTPGQGTLVEITFPSTRVLAD